MAIFRAGKRVGPFDIRVGFPRDKSLDNVDRDPRLKQYACLLYTSPSPRD